MQAKVTFDEAKEKLLFKGPFFRQHLKINQNFKILYQFLCTDMTIKLGIFFLSQNFLF